MGNCNRKTSAASQKQEGETVSGGQRESATQRNSDFNPFLTSAQKKDLVDSIQEFKSITRDSTYGVVRFVLVSAELPPTSTKVHATVSIGLQSFLSSAENGKNPQWNQGHNFVLQRRGGGTTAHIAIYERGNLKRNLLCYTTVDLKRYFEEASEGVTRPMDESLPLNDPVHQSRQV
eukprot:CAMPEP_0177591556 /NCGR_PEP_ID=MMETSP0419_2-20121207/8062_1 /TAXON_ID=582737 /ORGANISM="Tetraselmis sp., Strain GSL018" /LENGTH=175 /DNA_ID=CAMNT_0019082309 /DNA_START=162 /DNA_END=685 /DNA_ORIENTATION=-